MWRDERGGDPLCSRAEDCDEEGDECARQKALFVGHGAVEGDAAFVTQSKDHHNDRRNCKQVGEHRVEVDVRSVQAGDTFQSHPHKGHGGEYERPFEFGLKTFHSLCGITFPGSLSPEFFMGSIAVWRSFGMLAGAQKRAARCIRLHTHRLKFSPGMRPVAVGLILALPTRTPVILFSRFLFDFHRFCVCNFWIGHTLFD